MARKEFSKIFVSCFWYASIKLVVNDKKKNNLILIELKNSMKKMIKIAFVAAFAAIAGYGIYANQRADAMSDLVLANVEALARGEISNPGCDPSWDKECCVCFGVHHTYARANGSNNCTTRRNCTHY